MVDPRPRATLQVKARSNLIDDCYVLHCQYGGVFDLLATRYNPAALTEIVRYFGYRDTVAYDTPLGTDYMFHLHLILSKSSPSDMIDRLNANNIDGLDFYPWNGTRLDSYDMNRRPGAIIIRFLSRQFARLCEMVGGNDRKNRRQNQLGKFRR